MGLCFVSRTLGLQRIDSCRSQPVQAKETGGKAEATITMEGKRSKRVREGGEKEGTGGREKGFGGRGGGERAIGGGEISPQDLGAHLWVHTDEPPL